MSKAPDTPETREKPKTPYQEMISQRLQELFVARGIPYEGELMELSENIAHRIDAINTSNTDHLSNISRPDLRDVDVLAVIIGEKVNALSELRKDFTKLAKVLGPELQNVLDEVTEDHGEKASVRCAYTLNKEAWKILKSYRTEVLSHEIRLMTGKEKTKLGKDYDTVSALESALLASASDKFFPEFEEELKATRGQGGIHGFDTLFSPKVNEAIAHHRARMPTPREIPDQNTEKTEALPVIKYVDGSGPEAETAVLSAVADVAEAGGSFILEREKDGHFNFETYDALKYLLHTYDALPPDTPYAAHHEENAFFHKDFYKHLDKPIALEDLMIIKRHIEKTRSTDDPIRNYLVDIIDSNMDAAKKQRIKYKSKTEEERIHYSDTRKIQKLAEEGKGVKIDYDGDDGGHWDALTYLIATYTSIRPSAGYETKPIHTDDLIEIRKHIESDTSLDKDVISILTNTIDKNMRSQRTREYWAAQDVHKREKYFYRDHTIKEMATDYEHTHIPFGATALPATVASSEKSKFKSILRTAPKAVEALVHGAASSEGVEVVASATTRGRVRFR